MKPQEIDRLIGKALLIATIVALIAAPIIYYTFKYLNG